MALTDQQIITYHAETRAYAQAAARDLAASQAVLNSIRREYAIFVRLRDSTALNAGSAALDAQMAANLVAGLQYRGLDAVSLGVTCDGDTIDTAALRSALAMAAATGKPLEFPGGVTIVIDDDFIIEDENIQLIFHGSGVRFVQRTLGRGVFHVRARGFTTRGPWGAEYLGGRVTIAGRWRGYTAPQRMCALFLEAGSAQIEKVWGRNMYNTLCLRGPVERIDGTAVGADDLPAVLDFTSFAVGNQIGVVEGYGQDFVVTGNQQRDGYIGFILSRGITAIQNVPPHAVYMLNIGVGEYQGWCENFHILGGAAYDNPYGIPWKFLDFRGCQLLDMTASNCVGHTLTSRTHGCLLRPGPLTDFHERSTLADQDPDQGEDPTYPVYAFHSLDDRDLVIDGRGAILQGRGGAEVGAVRVRGDNAGRPTTVIGLKLITDKEVEPYRAEDTAEVIFVDCEHRYDGVGTPPHVFTAGNSSTVRARGSSRANHGMFARTVDGTLDIDFDSNDLVGFAKSTGIDAPSANMRCRDRGSRSGRIDTAVLIGLSSLGSNTYTVTGQRVHWWRTGDVVELDFRMRLNGTFDSTGAIVIRLPSGFYTAVSNPDDDIGYHLVLTDGVTVAAGARVMAQARAGMADITLEVWTDQARAALDASAVSATADIQGTIRYRTAAAIESYVGP
jgi:hypothetical protein